MQNESTYPLLQRCLSIIEGKLGWGSAQEWHSETFTELSQRIQEECGVLLSPTTLKRVWGRVQYASAPSITTLNTLALFAGFENWRTFTSQIAKTPTSEKGFRTRIPHLGLIVFSAAFLTVAFISFFSMVGPEQDGFGSWDIARVSFSSKPLSSGLPNSVVFDFDLLGYQTDSMCIQQYWDRTKRIKIHPDQHQATGIYYYPGYFRAKLVLDNKIIKEHDLFIPSEGWMSTIDYDPIPKYVDDIFGQGELLGLSMAHIDEISKHPTPIESSFHFVDDMGSVSGDSFTMSTTIQNTYRDKWAVCQRTRIVVLGTEGAFVIPFSIPGCVSDLNLMLNDLYLSGKKNDLSNFGIDLSTPRSISIDVLSQEVKISVGDELIFSGTYQESIGRSVGLRIRFTGAGTVHQLVLKDQFGKVVPL